LKLEIGRDGLDARLKVGHLLAVALDQRLGLLQREMRWEPGAAELG
jgi:hypothetical protein